MLHSALTRALLLTAAVALLPTSALATPLNLQNGDEISVLEWDADRINVAGDGGSFTSTGAGTGDTTIDGRITSVELVGPVTNLLNDVNFQLNATLTALTVLPVGGGDVLASLTFSSVTGDDIVITDNTGTILTAELGVSGLEVGGVFDTTGMLVNQGGIANAVGIEVTGGDASLVAAIGNTGTLSLTGTLFDFLTTNGVPLGGGAPLSGGMEAILANLQIDEDFVYSGSGTLTPEDASPFVPEPGASLLVGLGLAGLALWRRR